MRRSYLFLILLVILLVMPGCRLVPFDSGSKKNDAVMTGIDLIDENLEVFADKRVGLITNPTGINREYRSSIDVLFEKVNLTTLFSPEHGIRGNLQAGSTVSSYTDEITGLPVYSLYGSTLKPTAAMLNNVDILCIDLQDVGARFYTYIYTMAYAMVACSEQNKKFVVFDRPNPLGGVVVEGNILDLDYSSFIGLYPLVQRHGMTIGELARMFNGIRDRMRTGIDRDEELEAKHVFRRDRASLGHPFAEHAEPEHGDRLSRNLHIRGHEHVRRPGHDPAV